MLEIVARGHDPQMHKEGGWWKAQKELPCIPRPQDTGDFSFGNVVQAVLTKYLTLSDSVIVSPFPYVTMTTG